MWHTRIRRDTCSVHYNSVVHYLVGLRPSFDCLVFLLILRKSESGAKTNCYNPQQPIFFFYSETIKSSICVIAGSLEIFL